MSTTPLSRPDAVRQIAAHLADRTAFLIAAPPGAVPTLAERLDDLPAGWTAYLDQGTHQVLATSISRAMLVPVVLGMPLCVVVAVPKSTPARTLTEVLGQEVPGDGSQDLIMLHTGDDQPFVWPLLFVDALAVVDPAFAVSIHAQSIGNRS